MRLGACANVEPYWTVAMGSAERFALPNGRRLVDFSAEIRLWYENFSFAELRSFLAFGKFKVVLGKIVGYSYLVCNSCIWLFCLIQPGVVLVLAVRSEEILLLGNIKKCLTYI